MVSFEVEPRINKSEQLILREVIAKSENQLDDAILYLEDKIDNKSSAALDFAAATMYYQRGRLTMSSQSYQNAIEKISFFSASLQKFGIR